MVMSIVIIQNRLIPIPLSALARLRLLNVPPSLSLSQRERVYCLPSPSGPKGPKGEGGQRPGEGLRRLDPRRLDLKLELHCLLIEIGGLFITGARRGRSAFARRRGCGQSNSYKAFFNEQWSFHHSANRVDLDKAVSELLLTLGKSFAWHCCKEIMLGMSQAGPNIFMMQGLQ